jgi:hypothetical protein
VNISLTTNALTFEISWEDRIFSCVLIYNLKTIINFEKYFPKYFKCVGCKSKTEFIDQKLLLCDCCLEAYIEYWESKLQKKQDKG